MFCWTAEVLRTPLAGKDKHCRFCHSSRTHFTVWALQPRTWSKQWLLHGVITTRVDVADRNVAANPDHCGQLCGHQVSARMHRFHRKLSWLLQIRVGTAASVRQDQHSRCSQPLESEDDRVPWVHSQEWCWRRAARCALECWNHGLLPNIQPGGNVCLPNIPGTSTHPLQRHSRCP